MNQAQQPITSDTGAKTSEVAQTINYYVLLREKPQNWATMARLSHLPRKLTGAYNISIFRSVRISEDQFYVETDTGNFFQINY